MGRTAHGLGRWGGRVEDEFAHRTASGRGGRASVQVGGAAGAGCGQAIRGGHIPIGPPRTRFWLICVCVGGVRLGRRKK